ncbi:MAG TPA: hypothetical protein PLD82_08855 [Spirochaetota bacterium]|nr:hypothetical protein [Spirochaetota bacterium]
MRIMCAILSLILTGLTCPFSAGAVSPVRISGFLCLDPDLQIPPEGRRVTISLEDRKWRPVARTALAVHPGDTRIPWSLSVSQPDLAPGRLYLGYRISEDTGSHGRGWWSPDGTVYDQRSAGQILLSNGNANQIHLCILRGTGLQGRLYLDPDNRPRSVGIRLIDQSGRSRGTRWYPVHPDSTRIDWARTWPPQSTPERVRIQIILHAQHSKRTFWGRGKGLTVDPHKADEYSLSTRNRLVLEDALVD